MGNARNPGRRRSIDDDDPKKKKNRDAARKCREKKVKETTDLKKKNEELTKTNDELARKKIELERKLANCIEEIKKHKESGCELPKPVAEIINLTEFSHDFIPVGTQTIPASAAANVGHCSGTGRQESDSFPPELPPTATGLFSGTVLPANPVTRVRHASSRSSSRSPPPSAMSPLPQSSAPLSRRSANPSTGLTIQPSWTRLHQQTVGEPSPPGLSPAQTVPNIDTDLYTVPDTYQKNNGFPDIDEAVKHAQEDPGVMEDGEFQSESSQGSYSTLLTLAPLEKKCSLPSLGFVANMAHSSAQNRFAPEQRSHGNMSNPGSSVGVTNTLKRKSSGSTIVSMNHTAELLSQAMTNFDASEISEDLKKQFAQLASNQFDREADVNPQANPRNVQNDWQMEEGSNLVVQQQQATNQMQVQSPVPVSMEGMSYDALLELARNQGQNITVQYKGQDYECNYDQVEMLVSYMKLESAQQNSNNPPYLALFSGNLEATPALVETVPDNNFPQDPTTIVYTSQESSQDVTNVMHGPNITYITQNHFPAQYNALNQRANPIPISQVVEVQDQIVQLPTTVLSMIQEDTFAKPGPSNETSLDSIDYSENVKDLPSLSLTEDHTHIFEKRRRFNND